MLQPFIDDMLETMRHHPRCVGLAAPQVGRSWQIITVDASRMDRPGSCHGEMALLNPEIVHSESYKLLREGCLSVPDYTGNVLRATKVVVKALDREGKKVEITAEGFEAVIFQHEVDHVQGKLFLDRVASTATDVFRRKNYG